MRDGGDNDRNGITDPLQFFDEFDFDEPNLWKGYWWIYTDVGAGGTSTISSSMSTDNHVCQPGSCSLFVTGVVTDDASNGEGYIGFGTDLEANVDLQDLSPFSSIIFSVKGNGNTYSVALPMDSIQDYDYLGLEFATFMEWLIFEIPFIDLEQEEWGTPIPFDPHEIIGVEWHR